MFWIGVACKTHVQNGIKLGICQFCHGKITAVNKIARDDWVIYYSPRIGMERNSATVQQFTAIGTVTDDVPYQVDYGNGFKPWRRNVAYLNAHPVDIVPLIPHLSFIKNKTNWGMTFRYGLLQVDQHSFEIIHRSMIQ